MKTWNMPKRRANRKEKVFLDLLNKLDLTYDELNANPKDVRKKIYEKVKKNPNSVNPVTGYSDIHRLLELENVIKNLGDLANPRSIRTKKQAEGRPKPTARN